MKQVAYLPLNEANNIKPTRTTNNNMEMVRSEHTEENDEAVIAPSPFDSSTERDFLLNVPTAVPVDDFSENVSLAAVAVAAPVTNLMASSSTTTATTSTARTTPATRSIEGEEDPKSIDDDIIVKPEPDGATYMSHLPAAHAVPSAGSLIQQQHTASGQLRAANFKGILSSEEEFASIERAHRGIPEMQRDADEAVRAANIAARGKKGKKDEGLAVDHMIHHLNIKCSLDEKEKKEDEDISLYGTTGHRGGYQVKEYETSEYTTSDYQISEYKSVYD